MELELANEEVKVEMEAKMAQLRDAILILLTTKTMLDIQDLQGKNQLRQEILRGQQYPFSREVTKVYFTDFVVQ